MFLFSFAPLDIFVAVAAGCCLCTYLFSSPMNALPPLEYIALHESYSISIFLQNARIRLVMCVQVISWS